MPENIRRVEATDVSDLAEAMAELGVTVAGISGLPANRLIAAAVVSRPEVNGLVCECRGEIAGFLVCISNWKQFWLKFLARHPVFLFKVVANRLFKANLKRRSPAPSTEGASQDGGNKIYWEDSSLAISKTLYVGVRETYRGLGLGKLLYQRMFEELHKQGISRLDARIAGDNEGSQKLHASVGFKVVKRGRDAIFLSRSIED
ncbi:MAG: GNAT family N-acetyltransferase [Bdellovibrionales bacterium]|nr:GNAT family N-acetyltransferase [Bdellovibrionales bacterium]